MSENKYHINYKTGNPGVCKAKIKCPFGADMLVGHYDTKEEAREFYEDYMSKPKSEGARLVIDEYVIQREILKRRHNKEDAKNSLPLIEKRDAYHKILRTEYEGSERLNSLPPSVNNANKSFELDKFEFSDEKIIIGFNNDVAEIYEEAPDLIEKSDAASIAWIEGLTDKEVDAVTGYSYGSQKYSESISSSDYNEGVQNLHNALAKAPKIPNTHVYSGLSRYTRDMVLDAIEKEGKTFTINKALSTSLNPAQVNGFMRNSEEKGSTDDYVAVEIETNEGGGYERYQR